MNEVKHRAMREVTDHSGSFEAAGKRLAGSIAKEKAGAVVRRRTRVLKGLYADHVAVNELGDHVKVNDVGATRRQLGRVKDATYHLRPPRRSDKLRRVLPIGTENPGPIHGVDELRRSLKDSLVCRAANFLPREEVHADEVHPAFDQRRVPRNVQTSGNLSIGGEGTSFAEADVESRGNANSGGAPPVRRRPTSS